MDANSIQQLTTEISKFSDPGASPVLIEVQQDSVVVKLVRNGSSFTLSSKDFYQEPILLEGDNGSQKFSNYRALLSSKEFADLALWASRQRDVLAPRFSEPQIPPHGYVEPSNVEVDGFSKIQLELNGLFEEPASVGVMLVDGPAGVGKTHLIEWLAFTAAQSFSSSGSAVYLHVRSRGKVLSNIDDLMAFSLQALRLNVSFDQVPVLVRHGLVVLAIDGFDELGDPEGYGHAWGQLNDLIDSVKGNGVILLAGRETFIGRERLLRSVKSLANDSKVVELVLDETTPADAEEWLQEYGVDSAAIRSLQDSGLLERGSFALRPFFLSYLARDIREGGEWLDSYSRQSDVLPIVVNAMVDREVRRFEGEVTTALTASGVRDFVWGFLSEVAREMAGDQSESIAESMLAWIVEVSLPSEIERSVASLLKARAASMAFLALDDRPGYRRFGHSQFFNYFLSRSVINSIQEDDVPKWLRRGVVGADFLVAFVPFLRVENGTNQTKIADFTHRLSDLLMRHAAMNDGMQLPKNLAALKFATLCISKQGEGVWICAPEIQYAYAGTGTFEGHVAVDFIHMLDARSCDFAGVDFSSVRIGTVFLDKVTRFGAARPSVQGVREQLEDGSTKDLFDPNSIELALAMVSPSENVGARNSSEALVLLDRLARSRRYWFRPYDDDIFGNFAELPGWPELLAALEAHAMIRVDENRQASGARAEWFHIKNARSILLRDSSDPKVRALLEDLGHNIS